MNRFLSVVLICAALLAVCACGDDSTPHPTGFRGQNQAVVRPTPLPQQPIYQPEEPTVAAATPTPPPAPAPSPAATTQVKGDYRYAVPVQGKPGYVISPFAPDSGYVDVRGFAPGQEVRCPYTNQIFLVP